MLEKCSNLLRSVETDFSIAILSILSRRARFTQKHPERIDPRDSLRIESYAQIRINDTAEKKQIFPPPSFPAAAKGKEEEVLEFHVKTSFTESCVRFGNADGPFTVNPIGLRVRENSKITPESSEAREE